MNIRNLKSYLRDHTLLWMATLAIFSCFALWSGAIALAGDQFENPPLIGVVKKVSLAEGILVVKTADGTRQSIAFDEQTSLTGVLLAEEIKTKQKVKVWYVIEDNLIKALKIEVMPELGC